MHIRQMKDFLLPTAGNAYRPGILERRALIVFLGVVLAAEGFFIANLVARPLMGDLAAAVIGSELVRLTNTERTEAQLTELHEDPLLAAAAQAKAEDMAGQGYFSHTGPDGKMAWAWIAEEGYDYRFAGENLAVRFVDSSDVVEAWMASPTHKENITKTQFEDIGIGIAHGSYKGSSATFVVQLFGSPREGWPTDAAGQGAAAQSAFGMQAENFLKAMGKAFAEPRETTALMLGLVAAVLAAALVLAFAVNIQVQPADLLLRGSLVVAFAVTLLVANNYALTAATNGAKQQAAVGTFSVGVAAERVVIDEAGAFEERFIIER
jgi:uncharacterized RDD family membrane protein YckC